MRGGRTAEAESGVTPLACPLSLRPGSARGPDDYDVASGDQVIGRIFRARVIPPYRQWMWTITGSVTLPELPSGGFCASLDEAKTKLAETWQAWLTSKR